MTGRTRVYGLMGHPVDRSRSPEIYNPLFVAHEIDAVYVAFDTPNPVGAVAAVRSLGLAGVNVTVPLKEAVVLDLDAVSATVARIGAANVILREGDRLVGHNTDGEGWVRGFEAQFGPLAGRRVTVLGAGGAGRAIAVAALGRGAAWVDLLNRDAARAAVAAARIGCGSGPLEDFEGSSVDVVVCAIAEGGGPAVEALPVGSLPDHAVWCDINYWNPNPPRLAACQARGLRVQRGLPMLVHQAVLSFALFTGVVVDPDHVSARLR